MDCNALLLHPAARRYFAPPQPPQGHKPGCATRPGTAPAARPMRCATQHVAAGPLVVVHCHLPFRSALATALVGAGHPVAAFADPLAALDAMVLHHARLLVTGLAFGPGRQHGVSLARMARFRNHDLQVLFTDHPDTAELADGVGAFLPHPISMADFLTTVGRLLS
jgi:hypothetical protein